jgi:hypothetical protein
MTPSTPAVPPLALAPHATSDLRADRRLRALAVLTVVGFAVPTAMLLGHVAADGPSAGGYFGAWVDSLPGAQLLADLVICSVAFLAWAAVDGRRLGVRWWVAVPATFLVGLCFALPLYLYLRERAVGARAVEGASRA